MLADNWSKGPPEDGRVKLDEVTEVTIDRFGLAFQYQL